EEETFQYSDNDIADLEKGQTVKGSVVEINDQGVYVDVNYKTDGFIPLRELSNSDVSDPHDVVSLDEEINVVILTLEDEEGNMILSKKRADQEVAWEKIEEAHKDDEIIEAEITKEVKGGLVADVGLRGFIPASHVSIGYVEDLSEFVGETMKLKVIEVDRKNNNVVLSAKKVLEEEREEEKAETMKSLEKGQVLTGKVTKLVDFGAFVDIGGVEGLLHISEMSWGRIAHPSSVLEEGQEIEVKVLDVDRENDRISLGYKQLLPDPWEEFAKKHYEGEIITGKITKIVDFGAFMEVEDGIEGLIHISQLSNRHVKTADEVVTVGEEREAKIINIDPEQKRVGLSIKELEEPKEQKPKSSSSSQSKQDDSESESEEDMPSGATIGERLGDLKSLMEDEEE
ncbi:MAG: 30S ribosomal protein S1, partial [Bacillota bacterium]